MFLYFDQITIKFEWIQSTCLTCAFLISNPNIMAFDSFKNTHIFEYSLNFENTIYVGQCLQTDNLNIFSFFSFFLRIIKNMTV